MVGWFLFDVCCLLFVTCWPIHVAPFSLGIASRARSASGWVDSCGIWHGQKTGWSCHLEQIQFMIGIRFGFPFQVVNTGKFTASSFEKPPRVQKVQLKAPRPHPSRSARTANWRVSWELETKQSPVVAETTVSFSGA